MTDGSLVLVEVEAGVAVVTLNRPEKLNALNAGLWAELDRRLEELGADDAVRAVVLTGAGRAFCAGADLSGGEDTFRPPDRPARERAAPLWPFAMSKPVVAALNGHAIGVGLTLPMTCDIRFVAEDAKLQFAFVRRGVIPELASHTIVP